MDLNKLLRSLCPLGFLALAGAVNAAPTVYSGFDPGAGPTDPHPGSDLGAAAFDAAAGPTGIITFESALVGSFSSLAIAPGVTISGTDFFGANQSIRNTPAFPAAPALDGYDTTPGGSNFLEIQGGTLTFSFSTPIDVFGGYFSGNQAPSFGSVTLTFNDGLSQSLQFVPLGASGGLEFFGFTDIGASITSITISSGSNGGGDFIGADDIRYGLTAATVPDAGTSALLLGVGLTACFVVQRALGSLARSRR